MSGYFSRLVDRTSSRQELIRPRPAALFGPPIPEPDRQMHDPQLRSSEARAQEMTPRDPNEPARERESAGPARPAAVALVEDRPAQRGLAPRRAEPAREFAQSAARSAAEPEQGRVLASHETLPMIDTPPAITSEAEGPDDVRETLKSPRHSTVGPVHPIDAGQEGRDGSRAARVQRESVFPAAPIPAVRDKQSDKQSTAAHNRRAAEESRLTEQGPPEHDELGQTPQTHTAEPSVAHKMLQGRRSAVLAEATDASSLADISDTRGMLAAPARPRSNRSTGRGAESSTVHVTIGTLEVRANMPAAAPRAKPQTAKGPRLGLDEYLRQRRDGGRG
jgi:hypothetical protein